MRKLLFISLSSLVLPISASAAPLEIVEVAAPPINCLFARDCRITVSDFSAPITLPGARGEGFLQSRTAPPGEPATVGEGLVPYEYRIDLRAIGGVTAAPCITELSLDFGPFEALDYDGDGSPEDVFVVSRGGLGSVGPASADRVGGRIVFRFEPAVCAGNRPGAGESTFFFGLAAAGPPQPVDARLSVSPGGVLDLEARAPGGSGAGAGPCLPGLPISEEAPVCRCLRDPVARELRCALLDPDFLLVRRTPLPIPPGEPFAVRWTFVPFDGFSGSLLVEEGVAPGFHRPQGPVPLKFGRERGDGKGVTREYRLVASPGEERTWVPGRVTLDPGREQGGRETFSFLLPVGRLPWPGLEDVPSEPLPSPPANPGFGSGPCGRAAARLWKEHVERFSSPPFQPSPASHSYLKTRAERCRRAMPSYRGLCAGAGEAAWAGCFLREGRSFSSVAHRAIDRCRRLGLGDALGEILGGHRRDLIDL